jgi:TonB family protein
MSVASNALGRRRQPYAWTGLLSLALHAGLVVALVVVSTVDACSPPIVRDDHAIAAKLVRLGKPRDPALLPRKQEEPPPPPPAPKSAPVPTPAPDPSPSVAAKPAPSVPVAAAPPAAKPDPTRKLDDIMKRFSADNAAKAKQEEAIGALDGDREGDAERAEEGDRYLALVQKRIQDRYELPATIPDAERVGLVTVVVIHIDAAGKIYAAEVQDASSNPSFDAAVQAAIQRTATVPPPPEHMRARVKKGVGLRFRP